MQMIAVLPGGKNNNLKPNNEFVKNNNLTNDELKLFVYSKSQILRKNRKK
jgi:hypothetical protein